MKTNLILIFVAVFSSQISWGATIVTDELCEQGGGNVVTFADSSQAPMPTKYSKICVDGTYKGTTIGQPANVEPTSKGCLQALRDSVFFNGKIVLLPDEGDFFVKGSDGIGNVVTKNGIYKIKASSSCSRDQSVTADEVIAGLAKQAQQEGKVRQACRGLLGSADADVTSKAGRR